MIMNPIKTFAGLPAGTLLDGLAADMAIIGIPHGTSYHPGKPSHSAEAPAAIRKASARYAGMLDNYDFDLGGPLLDNRDIRVVDCGDVAGDPFDAAANHRLAVQQIRSILDAGALPIVLGGDDSVPIPFFHAFRGHAPLTIVQIDAHIDWRHEVNGIAAGPSSTMRRASEMPWVKRLIQVGMRGVGSAGIDEVAAARAYGAEFITAKEVHEGGLDPILSRVPDGGPCLVTVDCDGLDPSIMPAVNAPVPGGLSYRQVIDLLHGIAKKSDMRGFDIVELAPDKDLNGIGALTAARIVFNMIGALVRYKPALKSHC